MRLQTIRVFPVGKTAACRFCAGFWEKAGAVLIDHPSPEVTHLLLDAPSFSADGSLRGGGDISDTLRMLPPGITVVGGNLRHPALEGYKTLDLLRDAGYLAENAAVTADCALQVAAPLMETTFADASALIVGWGRIGKCLARMLKALGADVTVAARKEADRAMLRALGYRAAEPNGLEELLPRCRLIFNTAPEMVLDEKALSLCHRCVKIDLASAPGMAGPDVVWARGLPGVYAPESAGKRMAETIFRRLEEEKQ